MTGPPPATGFVDLHAHSTASDGTASPADVVRAARKAGVIALALTDHDTLAGVAEARVAGEADGVRVIAGVELSAVEGEAEVHVLGLHIGACDDMERRLLTFQDARRARAERIVEVLHGLGVMVTLDRVLSIAGSGAVGRPHVAKALIAEGWVRDFRDAFDRYLGAGRPAYVPKQKLSVADAVQMIHDTGGLAFMAHPGADGTRARVEALAAVGMDGVEVRHPGHTAEDTARLGTLVEHFGMVPTGGSDWHGAGEGPRMIGVMRVPYSWLERQESRLRERTVAGAPT
ncbi:MAG: PHP domain-containing protein [Gemmatimonadaceae bacterium]